MIRLFILALLPYVTISAQTADSIEVAPAGHQKKVFSSLVVPSVLIGAGIATINDRGWYSSYDAHEDIQERYPDFHTNVDDYLMFLPAAGVYGLNLAGVKGKNSFMDRSLIYLLSLSLGTVTTVIIKRSTNVLRPDGSDFNSFPSNHTTIAFVSASFLYHEYKDQSIWYGIAGYSVATLSGVLRMLNNRHWMSDVLAGAGLGILSTNVMYLIYPGMKTFLGKKFSSKGNDRLSLVPYYLPNHYGMFLQYNIPWSRN